jgi:hypothetical protein
MDPKVVLALTWTLAGLVVAAYIWFVVWRLRADRRKKAAEEIADDAMSDVIARTAQRLSSVTPAGPATSAEPAASRPPTPSAPPTVTSPPEPYSLRNELLSSAPLTARSDATVADLVAGIALPHDLVPLTTLAPRAAVGDRVAFWTDRAPAEVVGPAFATELERLGYTMIPLDERTASAQRDHDRLVVTIHPDGDKALVAGQLAFTSVPEGSVVIEVWVPA